jgi:hypothetical protein
MGGEVCEWMKMDDVLFAFCCELFVFLGAI